MSLTVFFAISWVVVAIYIIMKKELNFIESTVIFMFVLVISINFSWFIVDEFKLITIQEKGIPYMAYLLGRSVVIPFLMLIGLNFYLRTQSTVAKIMTVFCSVAFLVFSKYLLTRLKVASLENWNVFYDVIYFLILFTFTIFVYKWFHNVQRNAVKEES